MKLVFLVAIVLVFFVLGFMFLSKFNASSRRNLILGIVSLVLLITGYTMMQDKSENKNLNVLISYNQSNVIICKEIEVTNKDFNYVSGTLSFVAKESSKYKGITLQLEDCQLKK